MTAILFILAAPVYVVIGVVWVISQLVTDVVRTLQDERKK